MGVTLGLLGAGGSVLAVPILIYVAGFTPREAIGASLALVGATSAFAAGLHGRAGRVDVRAAAAFGLAGMPAAPLGARATALVAEPVLLVLFGALMTVVGVLMLRGRRGDAQDDRPPRPLPAVLAAGFGVGLLTGFLGVGGGFLIVPALTLLLRLPMPLAVGTSLAVIALNALAGFLAHAARGAMPLGPTLAFTASALAGAAVGTALGGRWSPDRLRRAFAVLIVVLGVAIVARNAWLIR